MAARVSNEMNSSEKAKYLEKLRMLVAILRVELRILAKPRNSTTHMPETYWSIPVAIRDDGEEWREVNPNEKQQHTRHQQLVERHLLPQSVHLADVAVGHCLGDNRTGHGSQRAVGNLNNIGNIAGNGVDTSQLQSLTGKEEGVEELDVARQDSGRHEEGIHPNLTKQMLVDKLPVETERDAPQGKQVEKVDQGTHRPAGTEENDKKVERYDTVSIEEVGRKVEHTNQHLSDKLGQGDMEEDTGVSLKDRHVEHKEGERQQEVDIVDQQRSILGVVGDNIGLKKKEEYGDDCEPNKRQDEGPPKETVVAMGGVFEAGIETEDRGVGAQLGQTCKEHSGIDHYTGEAYLLRRQQVGDDKKGCHRSDKDAQIVSKSPFNTLFYNNTHGNFYRSLAMQRYTKKWIFHRWLAIIQKKFVSLPFDLLE